MAGKTFGHLNNLNMNNEPLLTQLVEFKTI